MKPRKRVIILLAVAILTAAALAAWTASRGASAGRASGLEAAPKQTSAPTGQGAGGLGVEGSPVAPEAADDLTLLLDPDDPALPSFYSVPTRDGGSCITSSDGVLAGCMQPGSAASKSGTVTAVDDIEGSGGPVLVYGTTNTAVTEVTVRVGGAEYGATLTGSFYLLALPDPTLTVDSIESVSFTMGDGETIRRRVNG